MKNYLFLFLLCLAGISIGLMNSCNKDVVSLPPGKASFTEEFVNFNTILQKGWIAVDNYQGNSILPSAWGQGLRGGGKGGPSFGFTAYSYISTPDEFAYSYTTGYYSNYSLNSWLITPVLSVRNGDKISFYTRGDTSGVITDRMQVLMNPSTTIFT